MLNMFCPQVHLCPKLLPLMSKKWANLAKRWLFTSAFHGHKCNCWLKIVNHWDERDNGVLYTGKEIKSGLKLA